MSVVALARRPGFRDLLVGQTVSGLGDWMGTIAFMALALELSGSPTAVGGILALRLLPGALGGPLAARAASRWDRRRTMLLMDGFRVGLVAAVPLVPALWWVYVGAFLLELAGLVFLPARDASIPDLVPADQLPTANGLVLATSYATIPLGAACFSALAALAGREVFGRPFAIVFWVDAATFAVSYVCIARLHVLGPGSQAAGEAPVSFRHAFEIPLVRAILPATAAVAIGLGALFSLGIVFVRDVLDASDAGFGALIALFGIGAALGLVALQRPSNAPPLARTRNGVVAMGAVIASFSLAPGIGLAFLGATAFGAAAAYTLASGMGAIQSTLENSERIVGFAAFHVTIRMGLALAALGAGVAGDLVAGVDWPVVGRLEPSRLVLLASGLFVLASAALVRVHSVPEPRAPGEASRGHREPGTRDEPRRAVPEPPGAASQEPTT